jgi:hypothetical protein
MPTSPADDAQAATCVIINLPPGGCEPRQVAARTITMKPLWLCRPLSPAIRLDPADRHEQVVIAPLHCPRCEAAACLMPKLVFENFA